MIDHLSLQVADVATSAAFYDAVLAPLGGRRMMEFPSEAGAVIGYGAGKPSFWLGPVTTGGEAREVHVAFAAAGRAAVRAFHDAAVAAGAEVLHAPRLWPEYHPSYYGAFVRDPDGNNVEAVCHTPEATRPGWAAAGTAPAPVTARPVAETVAVAGRRRTEQID